MRAIEPRVVLSEFPTELVYHILDEGARISTKLASTLCLVAHWTRALALPHLYSGATLKTVSQSNDFSIRLKDSFTLKGPPHIFDPKVHLRGVWISSDSSRVVDIFRQADCLDSLALSVDNLAWLINASVRLPFQSRMISPRLFKSKPNLHLLIFNEVHHRLRWTFAPGILAPETDASPLFGKITHIQLSEHLSLEQMELDLAHYVNLSHLAIPYRPTGAGSSFQDFLGRTLVSSLVLVLYTNTLTEMERERAMEEIGAFGKHQPGRIEFAVRRRCDLQNDWEYEQRGGASVWDVAQPAFRS